MISLIMRANDAIDIRGPLLQNMVSKITRRIAAPFEIKITKREKKRSIEREAGRAGTKTST